MDRQRVLAEGMWFVFRDLIANDITIIQRSVIGDTLISLGITKDEIDYFRNFAEESGVASDVETYKLLKDLWDEQND